MSAATSRATGSILVADDDPALRRIVGDRLRALGHDVDLVTNGEEVLSRIEERSPDLLLLDLQMPRLDGFAVLDALASREDRPAVVVITAHGSIEAAVRAIRSGAVDLLTKPFEAAHLEHVVASVLERERLSGRVRRLEQEISGRHVLVAGSSAAFQSPCVIARRAAASESTILLLGESGTGKEVVARAVHAWSRRHAGPFVAVNCASLGGDLLESELFGHERGAFTGAVRARAGRVEVAARGTLFLDEIGELAPAVQARLLRVLQEREFTRVGGERLLRADVRVVAATHRDLPRAVAEGRFREDLYYRLNVVAVRLPPLRDRPEDIDDLVDHFLQRGCHESGRSSLGISTSARRALSSYGWPGNVRELANAIERAVVLAQGDVIEVEDLPEGVVEASASAGDSSAPSSAGPSTFHEAVAASKREILRDALRRTNGHQTRAARLLGLTQPYFARLAKNLGLRE